MTAACLLTAGYGNELLAQDATQVPAEQTDRQQPESAQEGSPEPGADGEASVETEGEAAAEEEPANETDDAPSETDSEEGADVEPAADSPDGDADPLPQLDVEAEREPRPRPRPVQAQPAPAATPRPRPAPRPAPVEATPAPLPAPAATTFSSTGSPLDAGTVNDQPPGDYKVERLSSPKFPLPLVNTPVSATIVPQAVIEEQQATSLRDVLQNVPGISITAGEGNPPAGDQFKIRGFDSRNDVFRDGIRDIGGYFRDPFSFAGVEVIKGPGSAFAGRGSTGATVNLVTKAPQTRNFFEAEGIGGDGVESEQGIFRGLIDANYMLEGVNGAMRLNVMGHDAGVPGRDFVNEQRWGVAPALAFGMNTPTRLNLYYLHMDQDNLPDYGIPTIRDAEFADSRFAGRVAPVDRSNFYGYLRRDQEDVQVDIFTAKVEHDINDSLTLRNQFRYGRVDLNSIYSAPRIRDNTGGQLTPDTLVRGNGKFRDTISDLLVNQTDLLAEFNTGPLRHFMTIGVEIAEESAENRRRLDVDGPDSLLFDPDPFASLTRAQRGVYNGTKAKLEVDTVGYFLTDSIEIGDKWIVTGAARWDDLDTTVIARNNGFDDGRGSLDYEQNVSREDEEFSWRSGVVYKPNPFGSIYFAYGTSFEPVASAASSTSGVVQLAGGSNNLPAEAGFFVGPEESEVYEIGTKWDLWDQRLRLTSAIFRIDRTNARNVDPVSGVVTIDGEQRVDGFEIGLVGELTDAWKILAAYAYLDSEILESDLPQARKGARIDNVPLNSFSLWTTYTLPSKLELGIGAFYVDERINQPNDADRLAITVDDFWRFDALIAYPITERITARVNFFNLFDEEYIDQLGGGQAVPGERFTALFSLTTTFDTY